MRLIGLTGKSGSGKDTVGDYISSKYDCRKMSFAARVKSLCSIVFDLPIKYFYDVKLKDTKHMKYLKTPRELMQKFATDFIRDNIDEDFWVKKLENDIEGDSIICDVRFKNEIDMIRRHQGIIISIEKDGVREDDHISEIVPDEYDFLITNNGTLEELYEKIDEIIYSML